jgi:hypothetical protein
MRTVNASQIFRTACALHGQPWSARAGEDSLSITDFRMVRSLVSCRLDTAWHIFPWPTLVYIERRFRVEKHYDYATQYQPGDQVFDEVSNRCWVCVQTTVPVDEQPADNPADWAPLGQLPVQTTNDPNAQFQQGDHVLDAATGDVYYCKVNGAFYGDIGNDQFFFPLPDWSPAFPLEDTFQRPMEEVFNVASIRPTELSEWRLDFALVEDAVRVEGDPGSSWFRYRMRCPVLQGEPWDAEASYLVGDQVYFTFPDNSGTGDFYDCIAAAGEGQSPEDSPLSWRRVEIPYVFTNYLSWATHADWLELDGQADKAAGANAQAFQRLQLEFDKIERQQRQTEPWSVATR